MIHKLAFAAMSLALGVAALVAATFALRAPYLGLAPSYPFRTAEYATPIVVRNVNEWLEQGVSPSAPPIIYLLAEGRESPTGVTRIREVGYPPLAFLIVFTIAAVSGGATMALMQSIGMAMHGLAVIILAFLVFFAARQLTTPAAAAVSGVSAGILSALLPGSLYFFFVTYYADFPVLIFFAASLLLEHLRDVARLQGKRHLLLSALSGTSLFCGVFTEWLFVPFTFFLILKRLHLETKGQGFGSRVRAVFRWCWPGGAALLVFMLYITSINGWIELAGKFTSHTGMDTNFQLWDYWPVFWGGYLPETMGMAGVALLCLGVVLLALMPFGHRVLMPRPVDWSIWWLLVLSLAPCLLHSLLLSEHYIENAYTAVKFIIPVSLFVPLLPLLLLNSHGMCMPRIVIAVAACAVGIVAAAHVSREEPFLANFNDRIELAVNDAKVKEIPGNVLFSPEVPNFMHSMYWGMHLRRNIWPMDMLVPISTDILSGRNHFIPREPSAMETWGLRSGYLPKPPTPTSENFTVGILVRREEELPEALRGTPRLPTPLEVGAYRVYVVPGEHLRSLAGTP